MRKWLRNFLSFSFLLIAFVFHADAQTTYDFSTTASLSYGDGGFNVWYTQANITIDGVNYKLTSGGNGSFTNQGTGGVSNTKVLRKEGSGGDVFTIQRNDGQPFKFYGFWVKHQSMNNYAQFYSLPPFYTITYNKSDGTTETYNDNTAMQGGTSPGTYTTSSTAFTKDLTVTSVSISFKAIVYYWIDDIIVGPAVVAPSISAQPTSKSICSGSNTSFSVTANNATSYQWQVNTGSGFANVTNSAPYSGATTATLSLTGAGMGMTGYQYRCVVTGSGTVNSTAAGLTVRSVSTTGSQTNISCYGGSNGTATVIPSGGTSPYYYSWSPSGGTGATASGLSAGTYIVTVTDNTSCQTTRSFTITQPTAALSATTSTTAVSCFGGSNGTGTVTASGGTAPYTYSWSPSGGTGATATGLAAGTYTVTITDNNSCQVTKTITVTQPTAALSATTSATAVSCFGGSNGTGTVTASGGTAPYTYSWSPSGGTGATASGLVAGTYTVTITDNNSCQVTKTVTVTQPTAGLSATTSTTAVSCFGGSNGTGTVTASGGTAPYSYSWSPSGGTGATASGLAAGTYTVTITDNNSCQITKTVNISQPSAPLSATSSKTDVTCNGGTNGSAGVTVSGGTAPYSYSWSPSGGTGATAPGLTAGTYTVTIEDDNSCQTTKSITITQPAIITATATPVSTNICSGTSTDIELSSNTSGASFAWTVSTVSGSVTGASASSGTSIAQALSGNGVIKYTITPSKGGCTGTTTSVNITVKPLTSISVHPANKNIDEEQNTTFSITASNATGYQWQVNKGAGYQNITNTAPYSGATTATLTITNASGNLDGYVFRCVTSGDCSSDVNSNGATLSVRVKATQTITINTTGSATYGDEDFAPSASSSSGLGLNFSSSDNNIASIVNGKVHIKKAGEVTITASQLGDNDYKPAAAVTQLLTIARKNISITLHSTPAVTKVYDGTKSASLASGNYSLDGVVDGDEVSVESTAEYADKTAAESKTISVTEILLSGAGKDNYNLTTTNGSVWGTISKREITLSVSNASSISKEYDGNKTANISAQQYVLSNVISDDEVSASGDAQYADKNTGSTKTITATNFILNGGDKGNYSLVTTSAQTTGEIIPKEVIARFTSTPAITKVYDGNASAIPAQQNYQLVGTLQGDQVTVSGAASFNDKSAGKSKPVTVEDMTLGGADKDNYLLANTSATTSGSITPRMLQVSLQQVSLATKTFELKKEPALNKLTYVLTGIIGQDDVKLKDPVTKVSLTQPGTPKGEGVNQLTLIGADAGNYGIDINSMINLPASTIDKTINLSTQSGSKVSGIAAERYSMKAWGENHQVLHIKIDAPRAQKVALVVYTLSGSPLLLEQKQLNEGVNVFTLQVSSLARGVYLVGVKGKAFNATQKVRL